MNSTSAATTKLLYAISASVGVTVIAGIAHWYCNYLKRNAIPQKWRRIGILKQLHIFPIKSGAPLVLAPETVIACDSLGLCLDGIRDRMFMIVTDNNEMITGRVYPKIVLIKTEILSGNKLLLSAPNMSNLELDLDALKQSHAKKYVHTNVFGSNVKGIECDEIYGKWISQFLLEKESGLRLIYYPYEKCTKPIDKGMKREPFITSSDTGAYNDATSFMLMNLASIKDLNTRLLQPVDPLQFRGGFYIEMDNDEPYAEDNWSWIKIGDAAVFRHVAPCARCIMPNINVTTGERDNEPLKTLKSYRNWDKYNGPILGIHLGLRQPGNVKINDVIYVENV